MYNTTPLPAKCRPFRHASKVSSVMDSERNIHVSSVMDSERTIFVSTNGIQMDPSVGNPKKQSRLDQPRKKIEF